MYNNSISYNPVFCLGIITRQLQYWEMFTGLTIIEFSEGFAIYNGYEKYESSINWGDDFVVVNATKLNIMKSKKAGRQYTTYANT